MNAICDPGIGTDILHYFEGTSNILRVVIPQRTAVRFTSDRGKVAAADNVGMLLIRANDEEIAISRDDAELVLNDGILNRLHIAIQLDRS